MKRDLNETRYFLRRDKLFTTVKPYSLHFDTEDLPRSNLESHEVPGPSIKDIRAHDGEYTFNKNGIVVMEYNGKLEYETGLTRRRSKTSTARISGRL